MNYPVWEPSILGGGLVIGIIAIFHVFVSHFAVGGGLFLVLTERKAYRDNNPALLDYVKSHSKFFVLVTLVFGAVSGVGIWWSISLVNPEATATLIHVFVWGWAIEWVFFTVESAAAFIYYYGWERLDAKTHLRVGWVYFAAAWSSLLVINGILTFMLTPGKWLYTHTFASAYFNPGMLPSLVVRTSVCIALAGVYALITSSTVRDAALRSQLVGYAAKWLLLGALIIPFAGIWYISTLPVMARQISTGGTRAVTMFAGFSIFFSALVMVFTYFGALRRPQNLNLAFALLIAVLALSTTAVTEWVRESVRKPYVIYGYMYSNSLRLADVERVQTQGVLKSARWVRHRDLDVKALEPSGQDIYRVECASCHTVDGYNSIRVAVRGWSWAMIDYQMDHLSSLKGFMPVFAGTEAERQALGAWLATLNPPPASISIEPEAAAVEIRAQDAVVQGAPQP
jgi:hypothetical protein